MAVSQDRYLAGRERVEREKGLFVEASSAVAIAAARRIAETASGLPVAVSTSTGITDPDLPVADSPALAVLEPTIDLLRAWVEHTRPGPALDPAGSVAYRHVDRGPGISDWSSGS